MTVANYSEYKGILQQLKDASNYTDLIANAIKKYILPRIPPASTMIDVGAGLGVLAELLKNEFSHITVLERNREVEGILRSQGFDTLIGDFLSLTINTQYDLVLCSHVLYGYDQRQIKLFVKKMQSLIRPGGYCFIALIAPRGKNHEMHIKLNAHYSNSRQVIQALEQESIPYERIQAQPHYIKTNNIMAMRCLLRFLLIENCLTDCSDQALKSVDEVVDAELQQMMQSDDLAYAFLQEDDYLIMHA